MTANAEPMQGSLFGDFSQTNQEVEGSITSTSGINTELSDQQLAKDSRDRPRSRETLKESTTNKDSSRNQPFKNADQELPAWSNHKLVDLEKLTPVLRHYVELKKANPDRILLYRLGDFFECFFEDAILLSRLLELTLTGKEGGKLIGRVPMAGVPHHAAERYCADLINRGLSIALCDQLETTPSKGSLLKRGITRVLTPGTIIEEGMLQARKNNWLAAVVVSNDQNDHLFHWGLAYADVSTGEFLVTQGEGISSLQQELIKIDAAELVLSGPEKSNKNQWIPEKLKLRAISKTSFSLPEAQSILKRHFKLKTLNGLGIEQWPLATRAAGGLLKYFSDTKPIDSESNEISDKSTIPLDCPRTTYAENFLCIDAQTRRNLELTSTQRDGQFQGSLLWAIDRTLTAMGARCLRRWIEAPLIQVDAIKARQEIVGRLVKTKALRQSIRRMLRSMGDLERLAGRAGAGQAGARDLIAIADGLARLPRLASNLELLKEKAPNWLKELINLDLELPKLGEYIREQLIDNPPLSLTEGGLFHDGIDPLLDGLRNQLDDQDSWLKSQEIIERKASGNSNLRIQYHRTFGYFLAVSKAKAAQVPNHWIRRQTLANEERFITPLLKEREGKIFQAKARAAQREYELFCSLREKVGSHAQAIRKAARAVAGLDALAGLAEVAATNSYCRPEILINESNTHSRIISIQECRHPVVEQLLVEDVFQPNNIELGNATDLIILTGPNASGKSCYLRQIGLVQLLAQLGSWVPAKTAAISIADRIFTRVGAVDDLAAGQSTFMVEMAETAYILNQSTNQSLVLLDEIGRGTATFDGLSIAWAVSEFLATQIKSRTVFATHYHELNELSRRINNVANFQVLVKETGEDLLFLHKVVPGGASRSYGIEAARLAGVPKEVIIRANQILNSLEETKSSTILQNQDSKVQTNSVVSAS